MFDIQKVIDGLFSLVQFQNTRNTNEGELDQSVWGQSDSGLYYNKTSNALLDLETLKYLAPNTDLYDYSSWDAATTYNIGDIVRDPNNTKVFYISLVDSNTGNAISDVAFWDRKYFFSEWLQEKVEFFCQRFINKVYVKKSLTQETKALFTDARLFLNSGNIHDKETPQSRFVGMKIELQPYQNTQLIINQIGFQFSAVQPNLPIYLFHSSQIEPLQVVNITTTKATSFEWITLSEPILIEYTNNTIDAGGWYYLGYYEDDIVGQAIKKKFDGKNPCSSCRNGEVNNFRKYNRHVLVTPTFVQNGNLPVAREYWGEEYDIPANYSNFGLNLNFSTFCDVTNYVVKNKQIMTNALIAEANVWIAEEIINSNRNSNSKNDLKNKAAFNLLPKKEGGLGVEEILEREIESIDFNLADLVSPCAPTKAQKNRITLTNA